MIVFARHGETLSGSQRRFEGVSDSNLTEKGVEQAKLLAEHLKEIHFSKLFVSPRGRARKTSEIVAAVLGKDFIVEKCIAEICYGEWEKKVRDECTISPLWKDREKDFFNFKHPGFYKKMPGESYSQMYERILPFFFMLKELPENILIISHSGILRCARIFFEGVVEEKFKQSKFANSVYFAVERVDGGYRSKLFDVVENRELSI